MKLYKTERTIISLENIKEVALQESTSQHTCKGKKYTISHHSILISYMVEGQFSRIELPDDDPDNARKVFEKIFEIISE